MIVLGIETSCDETAASVVKNGNEILSNIVSSQVDLHQEFGGVVPELACRRHAEIIHTIIEQALSEAKVSLSDIDLIAVAKGPGLIGALMIGINAAKGLALAACKPFIGVNHIEAHLYAATMSCKKPIIFPCLGIVLSGGHTSTVLVKDIGSYQLLGETQDDAIGEAFDKTAKILGLPYPGGPEIENLAKNGDPSRYPFKAGRVKVNPYDFSFSGLKTSVLYTVKGIQSKSEKFCSTSDKDRKDLAASFQMTAFQDVIDKSKQLANDYACQTLLFGGGVTNSQTLRQHFKIQCPELNLIWPANGLSLDNGAMIAGLGYHQFQRQGKGDCLSLEAKARIPFI